MNRNESSVHIERFITIVTVLLGLYLLFALRNSRVSTFQGLLMYVNMYVRYPRDRTQCPYYSGCPYFRGVRKAGLHCTQLHVYCFMWYACTCTVLYLSFIIIQRADGALHPSHSPNVIVTSSGDSGVHGTVMFAISSSEQHHERMSIGAESNGSSDQFETCSFDENGVLSYTLCVQYCVPQYLVVHV